MGITDKRGAALLTVLWLSAALSAIAFSVATTVRGETERVSSLADGTRAYYLAAGAVERAMLYVYWGPGRRNPDSSPRYFGPGMSVIPMQFPTGQAFVEVIPESAKLSINTAAFPELARLFAATGMEPERAGAVAQAVMDWRRPMPPGQFGLFDQAYLARTPSFRARHASFEEIEELLLVEGMTPDLFYGAWRRGLDGRLMPLGGLKDCLSVYGVQGQLDINAVHPLVLISLGVSPETAAALVERRQRMPFRTIAEVGPLGLPGNVMARLRVGGLTIFTLRATASIRLPDGRMSDIRRSVAATVKYNFDDQNAVRPFEVLRWYDNAGNR